MARFFSRITLLLVFISFSTIVVVNTQSVNSNCYGWVNNTMFYSLIPMEAPSKQYNVYIIPSSGAQLQWNVCNYLPGQGSFFAQIVNGGENTVLTGKSITEFIPQNYQKPKTGLNVYFSQGPNNAQFQIQIKCDSSIQTQQPTGFSQQGNQYILQVSSNAGCPKIQISALWAFLNENKDWLAVFTLIFGLLLAFFGHQFFSLTLFLIAFIIIFTIVMLFFSGVIIGVTSAVWLNWMALVLSALIGLIGGFIATKCVSLGFFAIGACGGFFFGMLLYTSVFHYISNSEYMMYIPAAVLALVGGIASFTVRDYLAIIVTSFLGSYLLVRSISFWVGGFPNEFILAQLIQTGEYDFPYTFYAYFAAILIVWAISFIYQWRQKKGKKEKSPEQQRLIIVKN